MEVNNNDIEKYPYYVIPDIEALYTEKDAGLLRMYRRRIAAIIGDQDALRAIIGDATEDFNDFYGTSDLPQLSTSDTIDSFLEKFGSNDEPLADGNYDGSPVVPVQPPVLDYASMLENEMEENGSLEFVSDDATFGAIDAFLNKNPIPRVKPKKEPKETEKPSLTEGFAKIMIKNGNYRRALEIITEISLNNPEKSIYFADQIRFLKKVISLESQ
ncbi:MAG: hypothetical protein K2K25_03210 [Muribaculaceae bacterium]|nr:hypothetical protein [Muribaculaceae bacterium]